MDETLPTIGPPDAEGWQLFILPPPARFADSFGAIRLRREPDGRVRCRVATGRAQSNLVDNVHGGFLMAFVDQALFCGTVLDRVEMLEAVTLSASVSFVAGARAGTPIDALVETIGETGRMLFIRGLVVQEERTVASFEGTLRKLRSRPDR